jgi:hypothetical protein
MLRTLGCPLENPHHGWDEVALYRSRKTGRLIPVDTAQKKIVKDDPTFNCLKNDLGVSSRRLLRLLNDAQSH